MTQHTVEPWKVGTDAGDKQSIYAGFRVASTQSGGEYFRNAANARRIVACVNALAGIPTEAIESGVVAELVEAARPFADKAQQFSKQGDGVVTVQIDFSNFRRVANALAKLEASK